MFSSSLFIFILLIFLLLLILAYYDIHKKKIFLVKNVKNIPILPYLPWIGSLHLLIRVPKYSYKFFEAGKRVSGSDYYIAYHLHMPMYVTANADDFQVILQNSLEKSFVYSLVGDGMEDFLLKSKVADWKVNRKIMNKSFKQQFLNKMIPSINEEVNKHIQTFSSEESEIQLSEKNSRFAMSSFLRHFVPAQFQEDVKNSPVDLYEAVKEFTRTPFERYTRPWLYPDMLYNLSNIKKAAYEVIQQSKQFMDEILTKAVANGTEKEEMSSDFLINLLNGGVKRDVVLSEGMFLAGAATDTTGITLTMTLIVLGIHPEIQDKVFREVLQVVGPTDSISQSHIQDLKYTEMVIKESMRLFPAVPVIQRKTSEIVDLGDGKVLPKDVDIAVCIYNIHRSETYWKDPLKFDPNRFLPDEIEKRHPYAYAPFSAGPRNCLGFKYAMTLLVIAVALFVREYKIGCSHKSLMDIQYKAFITLELVDQNLSCSFVRRNCYPKK